MGEQHGIIVVEGEHDVLVALGHLEILHRLIALPAVGADDERTLRLALAEGLVHLGHQLVPLLVIVGHGLVHELVGHGVVAVALQHVRQLIPQVDQVLLGLLRGEERIGSLTALVDGIEVVGADDMQIDDGAQMVLASPVQRIGQQFPGLRQFVALLIPELHLVDGDAHEVKSQ